MDYIFDELKQYDLEHIDKNYIGTEKMTCNFDSNTNYIGYDKTNNIIKYFKFVNKKTYIDTKHITYYEINKIHNFDHMVFYNIFYNFCLGYLTNGCFNIDCNYKYLTWIKKSNSEYEIKKSEIEPNMSNSMSYDISTNIYNFINFPEKIKNYTLKPHYIIIVYLKL